MYGLRRVIWRQDTEFQLVILQLFLVCDFAIKAKHNKNFAAKSTLKI
jgi:hypothetical protein